MDKMVELVGGGSVINGAYPVQFFRVAMYICVYPNFLQNYIICVPVCGDPPVVWFHLASVCLYWVTHPLYSISSCVCAFIWGPTVCIVLPHVYVPFLGTHPLYNINSCVCALFGDPPFVQYYLMCICLFWGPTPCICAFIWGPTLCIVLPHVCVPLFRDLPFVQYYPMCFCLYLGTHLFIVLPNVCAQIQSSIFPRCLNGTSVNGEHRQWTPYCSAAQCNAVQCNAVRCNVMKCNTVQCNAVHCNAAQCSDM